ncbi:MAG: pilus assembly PilX N-terminal domain-containing protein [Candidatus Methylomirabilales bacterium]
MKRSNRLRDEKGTALVLALMVIAVLSLLGTTMLTMSLTETNISLNERDVLQAFFHAEAGVEEAKMRLSPTAATGQITVGKNPSKDWRTYIVSGQPATLAYVQTIDPAAPAGSSIVSSIQAAVPWGLVRIKPKTNKDAFGSDIVEEDAGGNATLVVTSWGVDGSALRQLEIALGPIVGQKPGVAGTGKQNVKVSGGSCTDSYDSSLGAYGPGNQGGLQGGVQTDAITAEAIDLKNDSGTIKGKVTIGPGGDPNVVVSPSELAKIDPGVTPQVGVATSPSDPLFPIIPTPPDAQPLNSDQGNNDLKLNGNAVRVVSEGVYWVNKLELKQDAQLQTTGNVTIFVKKDLKIFDNAQLSPLSNLPKNLVIYVGAPVADGGLPEDDEDFTDTGYNGGKVQITGTADLYGVIIAPDAKVKVEKSGNFFGTIYAKGLKLSGGGCLHYDEALDALAAGDLTGYNKLSWKEVTTL